MREPTDNKPGGQPGHKGRTLERRATPDSVVDHVPAACAGCSAQTRAAFPEAVRGPVQYGPRVTAMVLYLLHFQLLPEQRLAEAMADLFGVHLATPRSPA